MIAVISHDAGGAEILSSYVRKKRLDCIFVLDGPARKIFESKLGQIQNLSLEEAVGRSESILCGTGWQSTLEFDAIKLAKTWGKHSIAFLDHWINYKERFIRSGEIILPDEIWVGDSKAQIIARKIFSNLPVKLVGNPYLQDIRKELSLIKKKKKYIQKSISILYVCEPIRDHALLQYCDAHHMGYVEEEALRYFMSNISALRKKIERVVIRPHPSELKSKYNWIKHEFKLPIEMGGGRTLLEEISDSDFVIGCQSMAMIVGLLAKKKVINCIPPGGRKCSLPHSRIMSLQSIIKKNKLEK